MNTVYNGSVLHENKLMICFILFIEIIYRMTLLLYYLYDFRKFKNDDNLFAMGEEDAIKCNDLFRSCQESIEKNANRLNIQK